MPQTELNKPSVDLAISRETLIQIYDELSEVTALNSFIHEAFLSLIQEQPPEPDSATAQGLALTCRWLNERQTRLKTRFRELMD